MTTQLAFLFPFFLFFERGGVNRIHSSVLAPLPLLPLRSIIILIIVVVKPNASFVVVVVFF